MPIDSNRASLKREGGEKIMIEESEDSNDETDSNDEEDWDEEAE